MSNLMANPFIKPALYESIAKARCETVRFYTSIHRAFTYSNDSTDKRKLGKNRSLLKSSEAGNWNMHSPKLSHSEFNAILEEAKLYNEYSNVVLKKPFEQIKPLDDLSGQEREDLFLEFTHNLEEDWNFHRAYYKLFHDISKAKTKLYIDLEAYFSTHHIRYIMKRSLHYLEGNYVTSLRREGKVYIPHLQFPDESVELHYTSHFGISVKHIIADYLIKEGIKSTEELLERFEQIACLKEDVAKAEKEYIFIKMSEYIDRDALLQMLRNWLTNLKLNFENRDSIRQSLNFDGLNIDQNIFKSFKKNELIREDQENYHSDLETFLKDENAAKERILMDLFEDLLQYSINRYRFENPLGTAGVETRTEYENVFRRYRDLTFLEQDIGCLLVECGEMLFIMLLWRYLENRKILDNVDKLMNWGLIEQTGGNKYKLTPRATRLARWCMKVMGLNYLQNGVKIDYSNKPKIARHYENLTKEKNLFAWINAGKGKQKIANLLGEMIFSTEQSFSENEITQLFHNIVDYFYESQSNEIKRQIEKSVENSRFNKEINEFLFRNETINRTAIAFPITPIPTEVEEKTRTFSIFIGSFELEDDLDTDNEDKFEETRRKLADRLNVAKIFFTLVGRPAAESMGEAILRKYAQEQVEFTLGRYQHKVKNEAVDLLARMDRLWNEVKDKNEFQNIRRDLLGMKKGVERFSGTMQILNIATNGLQQKYLEKHPYCILDVISEAYCNAFQQFYMAGPLEQVNQLWSEETSSYRTPLIAFQINIADNGTITQSAQKNIYYIPEIEDIKFEPPPIKEKIINHYFDAQDILNDNTIIENLSEILPQLIILQSPFFEIFSNAFVYMTKEKKEIKVKVIITKRPNEFVVEVINYLPKGLEIDTELREKVKKSAGLDANKLFFKNIGGGFEFVLDEIGWRGVAKCIINLTEMKKLAKFKE